MQPLTLNFHYGRSRQTLFTLIDYQKTTDGGDKRGGGGGKPLRGAKGFKKRELGSGEIDERRSLKKSKGQSATYKFREGGREITNAGGGFFGCLDGNKGKINLFKGRTEEGKKKLKRPRSPKWQKDFPHGGQGEEGDKKGEMFKD